MGYGRVVAAVRSPTGDLVGLSVLAALLVTGGWLADRGDPTARQPWLAGVPLLLAGVVALRWRRDFPVPVLVFTAGVAAAYYLLGFAAGVEPVPFAVALYAAASEGHRLASWLAVPVAPVLIELTELAGGHSYETGDLLLVGVTLLALVALGELARARRAYVREHEERARVEERLRIARELHDVLAHHLSVISIQSGAAILRQRSRPEFTAEALATIRAAAHEALGEVRTTLGVLRSGGGPWEPSAGAAPAPTLARLPELTDRTAAAGVPVEVDVRGEVRELPVAVDAGAYRIVQEALTNAARHARASRIEVRLRYAPDAVELEVRDDGRGAPAGGAGHGLAGMRERIAALDGRLEAGPLPGGGFRVWARIPA